ncbi:MAG: CoA transferase [Acidimicrobiales bacterium]
MSADDHPGLIMVSISGFGRTGPLASKPAFDFIAQAYSGIMHMTGETDGPPLFVRIGLADSNAGVHAFAAIGHALFRRERTGRGTHLDISMVDSLVHMHETAVYGSVDHRRCVRTDSPGSAVLPTSPASGVYRAAGVDRDLLHPGSNWAICGPQWVTPSSPPIRFDNNRRRLANRGPR